MRMIAGSILMLAATVLFSARWLGLVLHNPATLGTPESRLIVPVAVAIGLVGGVLLIAGAFMDRRRR